MTQIQALQQRFNGIAAEHERLRQAGVEAHLVQLTRLGQEANEIRIQIAVLMGHPSPRRNILSPFPLP